MNLNPFHSTRLATIRLLGFIIFSVYAGASGSTADFIIVESPQSVTLYNQFEQPLSKQEIADFLPYSPLRILRIDNRLGDQITRAMQCAIGQKTYYILLDEKGAVPGDKNHYHIIKGCTLLEDTVIVSRGETVVFSHREQYDATPQKLAKGTELVLLFRGNGSYYALQTGLLPRYGWIPAGAREAWKRVRQTIAADTIMPSIAEEQIVHRMESANASYADFFNRFNRSAGKVKTPPQWKRADGRLAWSLSAPYGRTGELDESAKYLLEDLRDILIGKPFSVSFEKGDLSINAKAQP